MPRGIYLSACLGRSALVSIRYGNGTAPPRAAGQQGPPPASPHAQAGHRLRRRAASQARQLASIWPTLGTLRRSLLDSTRHSASCCAAAAAAALSAAYEVIWPTVEKSSET